MRRRLNLNLRPPQPLTTNRPLQKRDPSRPTHPPNRPNQIHQRRQVVRPHIQHRPRAYLVVERRIGMPALMPVIRHKRRSRNRLPNRTLIDQLPTSLNPRTQKRIRSHPNAHTPSRCGLQERLRICDINRQRLLPIHTLPGLHNRHRHLKVRRRRSQIHHNLNLIIRQQLIH